MTPRTQTVETPGSAQPMNAGVGAGQPSAPQRDTMNVNYGPSAAPGGTEGPTNGLPSRLVSPSSGASTGSPTPPLFGPAPDTTQQLRTNIGSTFLSNKGQPATGGAPSSGTGAMSSSMDPFTRLTGAPPQIPGDLYRGVPVSFAPKPPTVVEPPVTTVKPMNPQEDYNNWLNTGWGQMVSAGDGGGGQGP